MGKESLIICGTSQHNAFGQIRLPPTELKAGVYLFSVEPMSQVKCT